jgi:hypothetical protein
VREGDHRVEGARLHRKVFQQSVVVVGRHEIHATYGCCVEADLSAADSAAMDEDREPPRRRRRCWISRFGGAAGQRSWRREGGAKVRDRERMSAEAAANGLQVLRSRLLTSSALASAR